MPIVAGDIQFRLSGGAANAVPDNALGGAKSATGIVDATLHNLYDVVSGAESAVGSVEYRCFYVHNNHATLTLQNAEVWIDTNSPSPDSLVEIGLGTSAINGIEQTVADETTAPTGVTFDLAPNQAGALQIGDIPAGQHKAVWIRRTIGAGASAFNNDSTILQVSGDTAA